MSGNNFRPGPRGRFNPASHAAERLPLMRMLEGVYRVFPAVRRTVYRAWYHHLTGLDKAAEATFTNYGYAPLDPGTREPDLREEDEVNRYCIQLYHHVAGAVDLRQRDVLEIGCGRGGGASYIARSLNPGSATGIDIDTRAIEFCNRHYADAGLTFRRGDGEFLPFGDGSFDVIINVESSHCYGSMRRFLNEVHRTLRPGGHFLFADFRSRKHVRPLRELLKRTGFVLVREQKITPNIFRALELDNERKLALIQKRVPGLLRAIFRQFAATEGTPTFESFRSGNWEYLSFVLRKDGTGSE